MLTSRRIWIFLAIAACLALFSSEALARVSAMRAHKAPRTAPLLLPAAAPAADATQAGAYGYRSSTDLARELQGGAPATGSTASSNGSATVVVTATVLPVRTIIVRGGHVTQIWSNLPGTDPKASLYQVRLGSSSGPQAALTARTWAQARALLRHARPGPGRLV